MADERETPDDDPASPVRDLESTFELLDRARAGDHDALDRLFARHLKPLQRWASGRLPTWARDLTDTDDLVQDTLLRTFKRMESFEPRRVGALQAYLRQAVLNRLRDELRRKGRQPHCDRSRGGRGRGRRFAARAGDRARGGRALRTGARAPAARGSRGDHRAGRAGPDLRRDGGGAGQAHRRRGAQSGATRAGAPGRGDQAWRVNGVVNLRYEDRWQVSARNVAPAGTVVPAGDHGAGSTITARRPILRTHLDAWRRDRSARHVHRASGPITARLPIPTFRPTSAPSPIVTSSARVAPVPIRVSDPRVTRWPTNARSATLTLASAWKRCPTITPRPMRTSSPRTASSPMLRAVTDDGAPPDDRVGAESRCGRDHGVGGDAGVAVAVRADVGLIGVGDGRTVVGAARGGRPDRDRRPRRLGRSRRRSAAQRHRCGGQRPDATCPTSRSWFRSPAIDSAGFPPVLPRWISPRGVPPESYHRPATTTGLLQTTRNAPSPRIASAGCGGCLEEPTPSRSSNDNDGRPIPKPLR